MTFVDIFHLATLIAGDLDIWHRTKDSALKQDGLQQNKECLQVQENKSVPDFYQANAFKGKKKSADSPRKQSAHLEVDVRVEYLRPVPHRGRHQRVLLRHVEQQLKGAALKERVSWALRRDVGRWVYCSGMQGTAFVKMRCSRRVEQQLECATLEGCVDWATRHSAYVKVRCLRLSSEEQCLCACVGLPCEPYQREHT